MSFDPVTYALAVKKGGGGGGGTSNYNSLENKPQINGVTLSGDKSTKDLIPIGEGLSFNADGELEATGGGGSAELSDDMTTAIEVGGIDAGTTYAAGTSLETVIRDMLEPTLYPTFTNPSTTISGATETLYDCLLEVPINITLHATFNRGTINPAYGTSGYRSGTAAVYMWSGSEGKQEGSESWSSKGGSPFMTDLTVSGSTLLQAEGAKYKYKCNVAYNAGEQPKDSKGNDYSDPLPSGSTESSALTAYVGAYPMFANTANIATIAKLSLINRYSTKQRDLSFPSQTVANPEVFEIPATWTVTAVQVKNDLSGAWEDASSQFTITDITHERAGGGTISYKRYTFNMGVDTGARQIRVKWS